MEILLTPVLILNLLADQWQRNISGSESEWIQFEKFIV